MNLSALPLMHPKRNAPLAQIGAEYRWIGGGAWRDVKPNFRIAACTFNDLGPAWTASSEWRCEV